MKQHVASDPVVPVSLRSRRGLRGTSVAAGLAIVLLLMVVGTALAVIATLNLNLAATEEFNTRAEELARAGINQFLADMDKGYIDELENATVALTPLETILNMAFVPHVAPDPNPALRAAALTDPSGSHNYPMPWTHMEGYVYITFVPTNAAGLAYSTWNCNNDQPVPGWGGRQVPAYSCDLVATARIGQHTRRVACRVTRRWSYAVACAQQIFIASTPDFPTSIFGDVYTRNAPLTNIYQAIIHEGFDFCACNAPSYIGAADTGTTVRGRLIDTSPCPASIVIAPGNVAISKRNNYKLVHFPVLQQAAVDGTFVDLTQFTKTNPMPDGTYLEQDPLAATPTYLIDNTTAGVAGTPGIPMHLPIVIGGVSMGNKYVINGTLAMKSKTKAGNPYISGNGGIVMNNCLLRIVGGSMYMYTQPCEIVAIKSCIDVDDTFCFSWGFIQSDQDGGFVIHATRVISEAGGNCRGLVVCKKGMFLGSLNLNDTLTPPAVTWDGKLPKNIRDTARPVSLGGGSDVGDGGICGYCGGCLGFCAPCGARAPLCAGTYYLGGGTPPPPPVKPATPPPNVTPASVAAEAANPDLTALGGVPAMVGTTYPLRVTGAILAPYGADPTQDYCFWLRCVQLNWNPVYLRVLHQQAPLETEAWEVLNSDD